MSLIQANILIARYSLPDAPADIIISYGTGKDRVPPEYSKIHLIATDRVAEMAVITQLQKELLSKMPDIEIRITQRLLIPVLIPHVVA